MRIPVYQVDAFTDKLFGGNPAAVCPLTEWLPDATLQAIAAENNLSETSFFVARGDRFRLRWFTPVREVELCGHATLAAAYVIMNILDPPRETVSFDSAGGELIVKRDGGLLSMDFPSRPPRPCDPPAGMIEAVGGDPLEALYGQYYMLVYGSEAEVRDLNPDMKRLKSSGGAVIATAPSDEVDFVSRFFAPGYGIDEDPVTGSAHCTLIPFWRERKSKSRFRARQISARGGELHCEDRGARVAISGNAVLYLEGAIHLE